MRSGGMITATLQVCRSVSLKRLQLPGAQGRAVFMVALYRAEQPGETQLSVSCFSADHR